MCLIWLIFKNPKNILDSVIDSDVFSYDANVIDICDEKVKLIVKNTGSVFVAIAQIWLASSQIFGYFSKKTSTEEDASIILSFVEMNCKRAIDCVQQ